MSLNSPNSEQDPASLQPMQAAGADMGISGYLLRLSAQADRLEAQLDAIMADMQSGGEQITALTRHLANPATTQRMEERLAELNTGLETVQQRFDDVARQVDDLNGTVTRLARTQFKGNTLAESKDLQVTSALAALREIVERREEAAQAHLLDEQARPAELRAEGRSELAVEMLPGLDGLELALESGYELLAEQHRRQAEEARMASENRPSALPTESAWRRLRRALMAETRAPAPALRAGLSEAGRDEEQLAALEGWLRGLELVHERFLKLLAFEGIQPIEAQGEAFNPRLHLAVKAELRADVAPGTVIKVLRKGYRLRDRVLRYAEVVVSRAQGQTGEAREAEQGPRANAVLDSQGATPTHEERDL